MFETAREVITINYLTRNMDSLKKVMIIFRQMIDAVLVGIGNFLEHSLFFLDALTLVFCVH